MNILSNIISIILIILILYSYYYIVEISKCPCFIEDKKDELNLQYIKFYLLLDLFSVLMTIFLVNYKNKTQLRPKTQYNFMLATSILLFIFITGYMSYNVYYFYKSVKERCDCVNKWQKYYIYYKGIMASIITIIYSLAFLFILYILLNY